MSPESTLPNVSGGYDRRGVDRRLQEGRHVCLTEPAPEGLAAPMQTGEVTAAISAANMAAAAPSNSSERCAGRRSPSWRRSRNAFPRATNSYARQVLECVIQVCNIDRNEPRTRLRNEDTRCRADKVGEARPSSRPFFAGSANLVRTLRQPGGVMCVGGTQSCISERVRSFADDWLTLSWFKRSGVGSDCERSRPRARARCRIPAAPPFPVP